MQAAAEVAEEYGCGVSLGDQPVEVGASSASTYSVSFSTVLAGVYCVSWRALSLYVRLGFQLSVCV